MDSLLFDSYEINESLFVNITAMLKGKDTNKVKNLMATVRALADKIDEL